MASRSLEETVNRGDGPRAVTPKTYDGNITDLEFEGVYMDDYPDFCDAFITAASWKDSGEPLSDNELDDLNENHSEVVGYYVQKHSGDFVSAWVDRAYDEFR